MIQHVGERAVRWTGAFLFLLMTGCSGDPPKPKVTESTPIDPATAGRIAVKVKYAGELPPPRDINMTSSAGCVKAHGGAAKDESLLGEQGNLKNAVVWIKGGLDAYQFAPPTTPVKVDQKGCLFVPHVAAAMAGQPVEFINSDPEAHNVHGKPLIIGSWNFMLSRKGATREVVFDKSEVAVPVTCDVHSWMKGYVAVVENPYYGITGETGDVALGNVPPGELTVAVWHEKLGTQEKKVTLPASGNLDVGFEFAVPAK